MFKLFSNLQLKSELKNTVEDIPKDLWTWEKEICHDDKLSLRSAIEYLWEYAYYLGKIMAYLYVLKQLGEQRYVDSYVKKMKLKTSERPVKETWKLLDKIWQKYHLDP